MNISGKILRPFSHPGDFFAHPIQGLEDITAMAAYTCGVSSAVLILKLEEKLFQEARCHTDACEIDSGDPLWLQTIQSEHVFVTGSMDGGLYPQPAPFTCGGKPLRSYAGSALKDSQGRILGILAVFDTVPHSFSAEHKQVLFCLARLAAAQTELRQTVIRAQGMEELLLMHQGKFQSPPDSAAGVRYEISAEGNITLCNAACLQLSGYEETEHLKSSVSRFCPSRFPSDRAAFL